MHMQKNHCDAIYDTYVYTQFISTLTLTCRSLEWMLWQERTMILDVREFSRNVGREAMGSHYLSYSPSRPPTCRSFSLNGPGYATGPCFNNTNLITVYDVHVYTCISYIFVCIMLNVYHCKVCAELILLYTGCYI